MQVLFWSYDSKHILNQKKWKESFSLEGKCWWKAAKVNIQKHALFPKGKHFSLLLILKNVLSRLLALQQCSSDTLAHVTKFEITLPWNKSVYM